MKPQLVTVTGDTQEAFTEAEWAYIERRLEKRRIQWRDAKRRKALRDVRPEPVGYLHALSCAGPAIHRRKFSCDPIPCYASKP